MQLIVYLSSMVNVVALYEIFHFFISIQFSAIQDVTEYCWVGPKMTIIILKPSCARVHSSRISYSSFQTEILVWKSLSANSKSKKVQNALRIFLYEICFLTFRDVKRNGMIPKMTKTAVFRNRRKNIPHSPIMPIE